MKKKKHLLLLLLCLFLITRFVLIFATKEIGNIETLYIGTIAKDIIEGMIMPFWDYQFSSYDGGTLLTGLLTTPFFILFGQTSFSLSLLAVCFYLASLILWFLFLEKHFNRRVAYIFSLLFILPPYLFARYSIVLAANHTQVVFFNILFLVVFYNIFFDIKSKSEQKKFRYDVFALGLISGLGLWFCYSFLVVLFVGFVFWYLCSKRIVKSVFFSLFAGFILGYSPVFFRIKVFGPLLKEEIFGRIMSEDLNGFGMRMKGLFQINLSGQAAVFLNIYWIGFIVFLFLLICKQRKYFKKLALSLLPSKRIAAPKEYKEIPILIYPVIYLIIYGISDFYILPGDTCFLHYRYLMPLFPFVFAVISFTADYFLNFKETIFKKATVILLSVFLLLGAGDTFSHLSWAGFPNRSYLSDKGFSYEMLGAVICWRFKNDPLRAVRLINAVNQEYKLDSYRGFAFELALTDVPEARERYLEFIDDSKSRDAFSRGFILGSGFNHFTGTELGESYRSVLKNLSYFEATAYFLETMLLINGFDEEYKADCYQGLGMQYAAFHRGAVPPAFLKSTPLRYQAAFKQGLDSGIEMLEY